MNPFKSIVTAACLAFAVAPSLDYKGKIIPMIIGTASAQTTSPVNVIGSVSAFGASTLSIAPDDGKAVETFITAPNLLVLRNRMVSLADIKPNDFVASAAVRGTDGKLHSTEVRIFPDTLRGIGEGQRPMDDANTRTMTNATVTGSAIVGGKNTLTVQFPGGQSELVVNPGVPVTRIEVMDRSMVKPGVRVRVQGARGPEGATARRITILE
jgi:hypothetical protein